MARVNRRPKKKTSGFREHHIQKLRNGHEYPFLEYFASIEETRKAWEIFRDKLLHDWIREAPLYGRDRPGPGSRPWAWWEFESPELLQRVDGKPHPFDNSERVKHVKKVAEKYPDFKAGAYKVYFGTPSCLCIKDDFEAEFESTATYLKRLDLLLPGEAEMLQ